MRDVMPHRDGRQVPYYAFATPGARQIRREVELVELIGRFIWQTVTLSRVLSRR
jgi:hypothetical protein